MSKTTKPVNLFFSLIPVIFLIVTLFLTIYHLEQDPHIPLILAIAVASFVGLFHGYTWKSLREGMINGIQLAFQAILILMIIGPMIGTWLIGGIVPSMIHYGLQLLSPGIFLAATMVICAIVSLGTGSSWSTAGTIGVALLAVGQGLGIPDYIVAGAIISGAYFGDKMSPLSDTTNLAPAVAGTDVFTHVRHMIYTTGPAFIISLIIYFFIGNHYSQMELDYSKINIILSNIDSNYVISPFLLIAPLAVILMVVKKIPPLPSLFFGIIIGALFALFVQDKSFADVFTAAQSGFVSNTGIEEVDSLLSGGGLLSMMKTVALIICALSFGGILEKTGMLETIAASLLKRIKRTGGLIATTIFSSIGMNVIASDQYMAIVVPGRMYKSAYDKLKLHPKNLSRALEDSATLTSPLIPWNTCGAFMMATLGVSPFLYLPFAFLNLITPVISLIYGYTGFTIEKISETNNETQNESISS